MLLQSTVLFNMFAFQLSVFTSFFYEYDFRKKKYLAEDFSFFLKLIGIEFKLT